MPHPKKYPYIEPTRTDSLNLVNSAQKVNDFFIDRMYTKNKTIAREDYLNGNIFEELDKRYQVFSDRYEDKEKTYNTSGSSSISGVYEPRFYRKNDTGNTFSQRETADRLINFEAPMSAYNRSIPPQEWSMYSKDMGTVGDDIVSIPSYNVLATTPADMLTDEQIVKRVEEFGSTSIPNSRLRKLGLPLNEDTPSASSLKRKKERDIIDRQLKEAGLYNRAEGITGRNPDASRMYEEYMKSKQPSQSVVPQVPNQGQSAGEGVKFSREDKIVPKKVYMGQRDRDGNKIYTEQSSRVRFRDGGLINPDKVTLPDGPNKEAAWASRIRGGLGPEYANYNDEQIKKLYGQGNVMTSFGEDSYVAPDLKEVTITSETDKERRDAYSAKAAKYFAEENLLTKYWSTKKKFQDLGKGALETVGKVASIPQAIGVMDFKRQIGQGPENFNEFKDAAWNKQETPSDVIDSFGPNNMTDAAKFALDFGMDPMWLMGSGIGKGPGALSNFASKGLDKGLKGAKGVKNALGKTVNRSITPIANASKNQLKGAANWINDAGIVGKEASAYAKDFFKKDLKKKLDKGNDFVKDWANHPATQEKLIKEHNKFVDNVDDFLPPGPLSKADANIMREKLISAGESRLKEQLKAPAGVNFYPIKNQIKDLFTGKPNIHRGNLGVSYPKQPYTKEYIKEQAKSFSHIDVKDWNTAIERQGDWVSRNAPDIESTSIHEGTHGWTDGNNLLNKKDEDLFNTMLNKESLESSKNYHDFPRNSKEWGLGYFGDPTEQHARIMELRNFYNLSPTQKISTKQASKMLEDISKSKSNIHTFSDNFAITNKTKSRKMPVEQEWLNSYKTDPKEAKKFANLFNDVRTIAPLVGAGSLGAASQKAYGGPINNDGPLAAKKDIDLKEVADFPRTGMMKARLAYEAMHGNTSAERMINAPDVPYKFTGEEYIGDRGRKAGVEAGEQGSHYMADSDNIAFPFIQQGKNGLEFNENANKYDDEAMKFDSPGDAANFAFNYKNIAPDPAYREHAYGGNTMSQGGEVYEAEGGEVIDGGNPTTLQGGHISPNSSNSGKIVGNSHGNGGVKMTGGEKIYSDRLTVDASFLKDLDI